jgi:hypothetical protein
MIRDQNQGGTIEGPVKQLLISIAQNDMQKMTDAGSRKRDGAGCQDTQKIAGTQGAKFEVQNASRQNKSIGEPSASGKSHESTPPHKFPPV